MKKSTADDLCLLRHVQWIKQKDAAIQMRISVKSYSELENNDDRPQIRTIQILITLGYTVESASKILKSVSM